MINMDVNKSSQQNLVSCTGDQPKAGSILYQISNIKEQNMHVKVTINHTHNLFI